MDAVPAWKFNVRFIAGVLACLVRPSGWRDPYVVR